MDLELMLLYGLRQLAASEPNEIFLPRTPCAGSGWPKVPAPPGREAATNVRGDISGLLGTFQLPSPQEEQIQQYLLNQVMQRRALQEARAAAELVYLHWRLSNVPSMLVGEEGVEVAPRPRGQEVLAMQRVESLMRDSRLPEEQSSSSARSEGGGLTNSICGRPAFSHRDSISHTGAGAPMRSCEAWPYQQLEGVKAPRSDRRAARGKQQRPCNWESGMVPCSMSTRSTSASDTTIQSPPVVPRRQPGRPSREIQQMPQDALLPALVAVDLGVLVKVQP